MVSTIPSRILLYTTTVMVILKAGASKSKSERTAAVCTGNLHHPDEAITTQFLVSGDLELGEKALYMMQTRITQINSWLEHMHGVKTLERNLTDCIENVKSLKYNLTELWNIYWAASVARVAYDRCNALLNISENNLNYTQIIPLANKIFLCNNQLTVSLENLKTMWDEYNISRNIPFPWKNYVSFIAERQIYNERAKEEHEQKRNTVNIFQYYAYPSVFLLVFIIGIISNGTLMIIFAKHREVRTPPNIMLFNLALADITNLLVNTPLYYIIKYHCDIISRNAYGCQIYLIFRTLNGVVIELSILSLSAQRYFATRSALNSSAPWCNVTPRARIAIYILTVWLVAFVMAFPSVAVFEFRKGECFPMSRNESAKHILDIMYCLFDSVFLPALITFFSVMTAQLLRRSVREMPGVVRNNAQLLARYRSARIVVTLAVAFGICFIPRSVWFFIASIFPSIDRTEFKYMLLDEITNYLMFSNSCINPIALYYASKRFRMLFNKYLFPCLYEEQDPVKRSSLEARTSSTIAQ